MVEYFYQDVVAATIRTQSAVVDIDGRNEPLQLNQTKSFVLTTSGGTAIDVSINDPELAKELGGGKMPTSDADKVIRGVRKMLREKKSGS